MAKALQLSAFGGDAFLDHLALVDVPVPEPAAGEVLVQPFLRPINPTDVLFLTGAYGASFPLPRVPGSEGVARVLKNGPGCSKFAAGQRVVAVQWPQFSSGGSWTTHTTILEKDLVAVPDAVDDKTAAQFFINPVTVFGMFKELAVPQGEYLLQTAATSVLGRQVIALAKHYGIKTINVVRRSNAVQELKDAGADEVISTDTEDLQQRVMDITGGKGAYAALDAVGGPDVAKVVASLRKNGVYLAYGLLSPEPMQLSIADLIVGRKVLRGFIIYEWIEEQADKGAVLDQVMKLLADKIIVPYSGKAYPLSEFKEAITKSTEAARGAKLFLEG